MEFNSFNDFGEAPSKKCPWKVSSATLIWFKKEVLMKVKVYAVMHDRQPAFARWAYNIHDNYDKLTAYTQNLSP